MSARSSCQREDLERIQRSQRHLLALINNLLDYAKIEGGRVHIAHEKVCVIDVIETVISLATPQMRAKEIMGRYAIARDLNLLADRAKVEQILLNLVINAVKFTPRGGSVTIGARLADSVVEITISDTGIGIPPEMMDVIFEPFMQLSSPLTSHAPGTGLGLAISRDLARLMNGTITVERALPQGAQFTVTLPAFIDVDEEPPLDPEIMMREF